MSELIRRAGSVVRPSGRGVIRTTGAADSTANVSFDGAAVTWEELSAQTRRAARRRSRVLAEDVRVITVGRLEGGAFWQDAVAWRLHDDALLVAEVARPVATSAGSVGRAGRWVHRGLVVSPATGPLQRRAGVIEVADEVARGGVAPTPALVAARFGDSAGLWGYLPSVIRDGVERLVPEPTAWWSTLTQTMDAAGLPTGQDLRVLRMSGERVVVVLASRTTGPRGGGSAESRRRTLATSPWVVEQLGFELGAAPAQVGSAGHDEP